MRNVISATFHIICTGLLFLSAGKISHAQQYIIANKDNTRPEAMRQLYAPARITSFTATRHNGSNDIRWTAISAQDTRRFIVEYSFDGINYQSAGEALAGEGEYRITHSMLDDRPVLYRLRIEDLGHKAYYSENIFLDGIAVAPVEIYPTIVTGEVVNLNAHLPVERVTIVSGDAKQVFAKDLNGERDFIPLAIPALGSGMYFITFYGNGWQHTARFIVS